MITLARDFGFQLSDEISRYYNINNFNGKFKTFRDAHKTIEVKDAAVEYMKSRGISEGVTRRYEITLKNDTENVIVFPFKDETGELKFVKYRNKDYVKGVSEGSKEWCESNCMPILFGMNHCNLENKRLILTEGQIDSLSVAEAGIENAVSVPTGMNGFTWVAHCWNWVHNFSEIIVFGDREPDGHITLVDYIAKKFKLRVSCVRPEDYKDCKDANEILLKYGQPQIKECINNAQAVPIRSVISLSDVKPINIYEMEKVKTGISKLDRMLRGGIPFGGVTLLSGKPGEGKSTLGSQLLLQAMEQGYKCFAYSGELPNYVFKEWLNYQAAGPGLITTYHEHSFDYDKYMISEDLKAALDAWYRGKIWLYDNDALIKDSEENEPETLLKVVENVVMQYDIKVVLLDNLMTAIDLEKTTGQDKYDIQSNFMKHLTRLALRHNLAIILVAHKRKNNVTTNENDEIAGSSDIANLGMLTLSYQKDGNLKDSQRRLKVNKNRLFGNTNTEGWIMEYDAASKRIAGPNDSIDFKLSYEIPNNGFVDIDDDLATIPF